MVFFFWTWSRDGFARLPATFEGGWTSGF